ncbi:GFA family protein [Aquamicrobium sp. LC103]|uniref:GFA family protein n=1 Tax=Aquamicrobium sp. LC103 TaxID=1120658 RepID=UPI0009E29F61|nr:GFA family protein [Aquamicrobium sp. LC103]TKT79985.1 GFA family protein [Aquamicrobium sp. LC103]
MRVNGSCHCGAIAFEAEIDPNRVRICHCNDCQKLSGTAFRVTAPCPEEAFRLLQGSPAIYTKKAQSGRRRLQVFCPNCGSPLYATSDEPPGSRTFGLRVGVLDQRGELKPNRQYWFQSALAWLPKLPGNAAAGN